MGVNLIRKTKVIVLMSEYSPENEVSLASGQLVVKLSNRGSSVRVSIVHHQKELKSGFFDYRAKYTPGFSEEIVPIPGLTSTSLLPKEAVAAGITYPAPLERIIGLGLER